MSVMNAFRRQSTRPRPYGEPATTSDETSPDRKAELDEWERSKVGDRLASFGVLLPASPPGPVVLAIDPEIADVLRCRYADVLVLNTVRSRNDPARSRYDTVRSRIQRSTRARGVLWDGVHSPLAPRSAALIVADREVSDVDALRPALAPGGVFAVIGSQGDYVIYPSIERPEHVWRTGWPLPTRPGLVAQIRRSAGILMNRRRESPRLALDGPEIPSLAHRVLADVAAQTGMPGRLIGIETAGRTILRVRQPDGDIAVRLAITNTEQHVSVGGHVAADVPQVRALVQAEVARGTTMGCPWVATRWLPSGRRSIIDLCSGQRCRWKAAELLVEALQTVRTGTTEPGWARSWCAKAVLAPPADRKRLADAMAALDDGLPLGWCHGDPWPPNVLIEKHAAAVIDWENATPDAPQGLDWLLIAALRDVRGGRGSFAAACKRLMHAELPVNRPVAGRPFGEWDAEHRIGLAVATFMLYLRNRSLYDLGEESLRSELAQMADALESAPGDDPPGDTRSSEPTARRAARGAGWLGLSAAVVKGAQTLVLLVLASLLMPSALGLIAIGTMITNVSQVLSDLGTNIALIYWRGNARRAARSAVTISLTMNVVIAGTVWLIAPWLSHTLHAQPDGTWVIRGLVSVLPCYGVASTSLELLRRELAFVRRVLPDMVAALTGAAVAVALAAQGHGVASLVVGQIVQGVLTLLLAWTVGGVIRPGWRTDDVRGLLRYGTHLTGANLLQLIVFNVDYVIVARVLGATSLGQYSLAFRLAFLPYLNVAFVIAGAAFPYLCRLGEGAVGPAVSRLVGAAMKLLIPLCLGIALFADQLQLLGTKWEPAVAVARWLALYAALLSLAQLAQTALNSIGRPRNTLQLQLLHLVVLVTVLAVLARYGIAAVAVGQVLAATAECAVALAVARKYIAGLQLQRLAGALAPAAAGAIGMTVTVLAVHAVFPATVVSVPGLLAVGALGLAAYLVPIVLLDRENLVRTVAIMARPS